MIKITSFAVLLQSKFKNPKVVFVMLVVAILILSSLSSVKLPLRAAEKGDKNILGATSAEATLIVSTPTPTIGPTIQIPSKAPSQKLSVTTTTAPTATPVVSNSFASQSNSNSTSQSDPTPTATILPTAIPTIVPTTTPIPTATPSQEPQAEIEVIVAIDYAGQKANDSITIKIPFSKSTWEAVVEAVGIGNLQYTDYGGSMGIFITGFNGIIASSNQYFEFRVNGASSSVGVSSYICNDHDKLEFVLTNF